MDRHAGLTPAQEELLHALQEECAEVIQAASKALIHGWAPTDRSQRPPREYDNRKDLATEVGQAMAIARLLCEAGDLDHAEIQRAFDKRYKEKRYFHHQD